MKRLYALFLILIIIASLCACKGKDTGATLKDVNRLQQNSTSQSTSKEDSSSEKEESSSKQENSSIKENLSASSKKEEVSSKQTTASEKDETQKPTPQQLIHGSWNGEVPMNDFFEAQGMSADKTLYLTFNMTFFPGGSYRESVSTNSYKKLMWDVMNHRIAESGMTKAEFEAQYEQQAGMTLEEYIDQYVQSTINDFVTDYHYKFEGDKLYYKEVIAPETEYKEMGYRFSDDGNIVEFTQDGQKALFYRE